MNSGFVQEGDTNHLQGKMMILVTIQFSDKPSDFPREIHLGGPWCASRTPRCGWDVHGVGSKFSHYKYVKEIRLGFSVVSPIPNSKVTDWSPTFPRMVSSTAGFKPSSPLMFQVLLIYIYVIRVYIYKYVYIYMYIYVCPCCSSKDFSKEPQNIQKSCSTNYSSRVYSGLLNSTVDLCWPTPNVYIHGDFTFLFFLCGYYQDPRETHRPSPSHAHPQSMQICFVHFVKNEERSAGSAPKPIVLSIIHICMHIYIYTYVNDHMYVYIHIYIYIYIPHIYHLEHWSKAYTYMW